MNQPPNIRKNRNKFLYCRHCSSLRRSDAIKSHEVICLARAVKADQKLKRKAELKVLRDAENAEIKAKRDLIKATREKEWAERGEAIRALGHMPWHYPPPERNPFEAHWD